MKIADLKKKTEKELEQLLKDKTEALRAFRFAMSGSKTKDLRAGRNIRREIAQIKTVFK